MKDIYSPLEIDEEWDNYAPAADGSSTALMERPADVSTDGPTEGNGLNTEAAMATKIAVTSPDSPDVMPKSNVMPGQPDAAYNAAEALIDTPAADADTFTTSGPAATSGDTFDINDTRGLVKITPEPTSGETTPGETTPGETTTEIPSTDTPHEMIPVNVNVMGGEAADSGDKLPEVVDQSNGESAEVSDATKSIDTEAGEDTTIAPFIAPVEPGEEPKEETDEQTDEGDSDDVIDTGTITPDTIKASDDDGGESSDDMVKNSESDAADDTDDTESDTAASSSETKADQPKAPTSASDDELAGILDKWDQSNKEIADMLKAARKEIEANVLRMSDQKTNLKTDLEQQIADLEEGIANENARLAKIETNLAKLPSDEAN